MRKEDFSSPMDLERFQITDSFWKKEIDLIRETVIPYQWEALNDRIPEANPSYCMHNFKVAARQNKARLVDRDYVPPVHSVNGFCVWPENPNKLEDRFYGFVFQDSDFAKWIESVAYSLQQHPDPELEKTADEAIEIVCQAQREDGYLDTFYIINDISKRFTNLRDHHELYCLGHLIEGAVAYYKATGKDKLLNAARRYAECVAAHLGSEEGKKPGYPGHEIAEMALARLYEVTGDDSYLKLGLYFINERGQRPYYFDAEHPPKSDEVENLRYQYHQAHLPVREQQEALGHAVRAVYLYSGMADFARLTGDEGLKEACEKLWDDITQRKMYITGGIGGTHIGEAFSFPYDLPNDTAYAETCASIGMVFFARRMLEIEADSRYADIMERELYNGVLSGMALDGTSFFYVNPLEVLPEACHKDERKEHVKPVRQKWFGCACCPPNLARVISSVGAYAVTEKEDTLYIHQYIGGTIKKQIGEKEAVIRMDSGFPWDGRVRIQVEYDGEEEFTLALRIPQWCEEYQIQGIENAETKLEKGYLYLKQKWNGSVLEIDFPMETRLFDANQQVREDIGKVALMRGPLVYCLEEADNGKNLHLLKINPQTEFSTEQMDIAGEQVTAVCGTGWKQRETKEDSLYRQYSAPAYEEVEVKWIPYYAWANRGEGEMQVWSRV